jgi:nicotinate-nucleotide pyrophosphorylase (carboxylating)
MHSSLLPSSIDRIVEWALLEDLAGGDLTTEACVDGRTQAVAHALAKRDLVACGVEVFERAFHLVDDSVRVERLVGEGDRVPAGTKLWTARGAARSLLMGERTALNFVQRMTGIATMARRYVEAVPKGCATRITDTRKTTPGLRLLERYAVRVGGASNHRNDLSAAVLIKDNHIAACGGVGPAVARARQRAPHTSRIECEVTNLDELGEALAAGADIVLLDNMDTPTIERAVEQVAEHVRTAGGRVFTEASGGVTLERIAELAEAGVDFISVGALTHSAPSADISLELSLA